MRVAIIGWGSLIRCPGNLTLGSKWHRGGPEIPIEFARASGGKRLTLIVYPKADPQPTFWALSGCEKLEEAQNELRRREGIGRKHAGWIHAIDDTGEFRGHDRASPARVHIAEWLRARTDVDAAVWAGLGPEWPADVEDSFGVYSMQAAISFLKDLQERGIHHGAELYVRHVPPEVDTPLRRAIEKELGWVREPLSSGLLEE